MKTTAMPVLFFAMLFTVAACKGDSGDGNACRMQTTFTLVGGSSELDFATKVPPVCTAYVPRVTKAYAGQTLTGWATFILTSDSPPSERGGTPVDISFTVDTISPDGVAKTIASDHFGENVGYDAINTVPCKISVAIPQDATPGVHTFRFHAIDAVSGASADAETTLNVFAWNYPAGSADMGKMDEYFRDPDPDFLHRYTFSRDLDLDSPDDISQNKLCIVSFFRHAYLSQSFLLCRYRADFKIRNAFERKRILLLFAVTGCDPVPDGELDRGEIAYQNAVRAMDLRDPYQSIDLPGDLDVLWGEFFATGGYKPVRRILDALNYRKEGEITKKMLRKNRAPQSESESVVFWHGSVYQSAVWSVTFNSVQHELVAQYYFWTLINDSSLGDDQRETIATVLCKIFPDYVKVTVGR